MPGDMVVFESGDIVTADIRLVEARNLCCDESTLTGESTPVEKSIAPAAPEAIVADRTSMVHKGTAITRGTGAGVVVATGMATELGLRGANGMCVHHHRTQILTCASAQKLNPASLIRTADRQKRRFIAVKLQHPRARCRRASTSPPSNWGHR